MGRSSASRRLADFGRFIVRDGGELDLDAREPLHERRAHAGRAHLLQRCRQRAERLGFARVALQQLRRASLASVVLERAELLALRRRSLGLGDTTERVAALSV